MTFYGLKSIIAANKTRFNLRTPQDSFCVVSERPDPYIEPFFEKLDFPAEKPPIILISAVGATGKTTLARVLSKETGLPLLDLGKHKPVGDNTLTGLLTNAFSVEHLSQVFAGIGAGTFGAVIDGIDEARSKTTERAFEAFLDDLVRLSRGADSPSFVLLGRTQILEDCWLYLSDQDVKTGLVNISPFDLTQARSYIDTFSNGLQSGHAEEYSEVRDAILELLSSAFQQRTANTEQTFTAFIGYPPVLDAIVTLLTEEQNFHKLKSGLEITHNQNIEVDLLLRIASYILQREREQKVIPNIVEPLITEMDEKDRRLISSRVFDIEEQCRRLVSLALGKGAALNPIGEPLLDEKYETQLETFLPEHPFISNGYFRNAIFEAFAISTLILSDKQESTAIALTYASQSKSNYHLIYLMSEMAPDRRIPIEATSLIVGSALELQSRAAAVEIGIESKHDRLEASKLQNEEVEIRVEILVGSDRSRAKAFVFCSEVSSDDSVHLGSRLSSAVISLPCNLVMSSNNELEFGTPVEVSARRVTLSSPSLVVRIPIDADERHVTFECDGLECSASTIMASGAELVFAVADRSGLTFPAIQYVEDRTILPLDPKLQEKYLRLRRVLVEFRSHSKGTLAKYRHKIEHERVLRNETGRAILRRCLEDGILRLEGSFYFLEPDQVDKHLGISWLDLRKGRTSPKLLSYLTSVRVDDS